MRFAHPAWLVLAAAAIPAGLLAEIARRASGRRLRALGGRPGSASFWRRVVLPGAALALLGAAAAGPTWGYRDVPARVAESDLVLAFDTSGSMLTKDLAPDRFSVARRFARELLRQLPGEIRVALVRMEGEGEVIVPLTLDRAAVIGALDELSPRGAVQPGSDLGDGLKKAEALLAARDARSRAILLV
jgi:Ca-activated chloride channel homolog